MFMTFTEFLSKAGFEWLSKQPADTALTVYNAFDRARFEEVRNMTFGVKIMQSNGSVTPSPDMTPYVERINE